MLPALAKVAEIIRSFVKWLREISIVKLKLGRAPPLNPKENPAAITYRGRGAMSGFDPSLKKLEPRGVPMPWSAFSLTEGGTLRGRIRRGGQVVGSHILEYS